jgi:hypothetical protein
MKAEVTNLIHLSLVWYALPTLWFVSGTCDLGCFYNDRTVYLLETCFNDQLKWHVVTVELCSSVYLIIKKKWTKFEKHHEVVKYAFPSSLCSIC